MFNLDSVLCNICLFYTFWLIDFFSIGKNQIFKNVVFQFCLHTRILCLIRSYINLFQSIQEYRTILQRKYTLFINAEVKTAAMLVHHNTFFNLSDNMTQYVKTKFKGSPTAENFSCGHTKTSAIVNCIGNFLQEQLIQDMKNWPFSIMMDGSNDTGLEKTLPITVRIFNVSFGKVITKFFYMNLLSGRDSGPAEVMFDGTDAQFTKHGV